MDAARSHHHASRAFSFGVDSGSSEGGGMGAARGVGGFRVAAAMLAGAPIAAARQLAFDERVRAQEALARVYHRHQVGSPRSFEQTVPRELLERRVERYLAL